MSASYTDEYWISPDGLKLYYRDYAGPNDKPPVLCLHGLTRNSRDFAPLAETLAGDWRVIVPEMRGRGNSEYAKDTSTYTPPTYIKDVEALLAELGIEKFVAIGTSMGGLMTMLMAAKDASRIVAPCSTISDRKSIPRASRILLAMSGKGAVLTHGCTLQTHCAKRMAQAFLITRLIPGLRWQSAPWCWARMGVSYSTMIWGSLIPLNPPMMRPSLICGQHSRL